MRPMMMLAMTVLLSMSACTGENRQVPEQTGSAEPAAETASAVADPGHVSEVEAWRRGRIERLTSEEGWLTLVGLEWIEPGANSVGSAEGSDIRLPPGAPPKAGTIILENGQVRFIPAVPPVLMTGAALAGEMRLATDAEEKPTTLHAGSLKMYVIKRGDRFGVRMKDSRSPARLHFAGIEHYPVDTSWRVTARFEPYSPARELRIQDVTGSVDTMIAPGALLFDREGKTYRLDALLEEPDADQLFIIFADATSGKETYGAGRYIYVARPDASGNVVIDFNRAYNPPCAFTNFATCPLPPRQNRLEIPVTAGEKKYRGAAH